MIRSIAIEIVLFLVPFAVYATFLTATRAKVFERASWPLPVIGWLTVTALFCILLSYMFLAHFSGAPPGFTYVPAHIEDGKFVPATRK